MRTGTQKSKSIEAAEQPTSVPVGDGEGGFEVQEKGAAPPPPPPPEPPFPPPGGDKPHQNKPPKS